MTQPSPFTDPPTDAEIEAAQRFGVSVDLYRQFKQNAGAAADRLERGDGPEDIAAEARLAQRMRRDSGGPPGVFTSAAKTPGQAAQTVLTISCYLVLMFLIIGFGGERVQRVPGVFQVMAAGLLLIPAMMISSWIWRGIGERLRDRVRVLFRFWPLTLLALIFLLGGIRMLWA